MAKKKSTPTTAPLQVRIHEALPNPMFSEQQRQLIRFLRYNQHVPCAECGKKARTHWTMLCQFIPQTMGQFAMKPGKSHAPLTPVCQDHPLAIDWPEAKKK